MNRSTTAVLASALLLGAAATGAVNNLSDGAKGQHVRLEEVTRVLTLQPGETVDVSTQCADNEAVTGGSPTSWPAGVKAVGSNVWWDGVHSGGWTVTFKNTTRSPVTGQLSTAALCVVPGYITH